MFCTHRKVVFSSFLFFSLVFLLTVPIQSFTVRSTDKTLLYSYPMTSRDSFVLGFIHSVEKTPVESEYRVFAGRIWQWEERFISHNAGLPTEAPRNGKFIMSDSWMILRGGGVALPLFRYRVGDYSVGRNIMILPDGLKIKLYKEYPRNLLFLAAESASLLEGYFSCLF